MKKVLVTGGTGFIGKKLVNTLTSLMYEVTILSRKKVTKIDNKSNSIKIVHGDVSNLEDLINASKSVDIIYHLAAAMSGDWNEHNKSTVIGTENVIQAVAENMVKHLIYVSTLNIYDSNLYEDGLIVGEDFEYEPHSELRGYYSAAKLKAERLLIKNSANSEHKLTILRPGLVYGNISTILPKDVAIPVYKSVHVIIGNGSRKLPIVNVENLIDALVLCETMQQNKFEIFNVVDDEYPTQREYINKLNRFTATKMHIIYLPIFMVRTLFFIADKFFGLLSKNTNFMYRFNTLIKSPIFSTKNIKDKLDWKPRLSLNEFLVKIFT